MITLKSPYVYKQFFSGTLSIDFWSCSENYILSSILWEFVGVNVAMTVNTLLYIEKEILRIQSEIGSIINLYMMNVSASVLPHPINIDVTTLSRSKDYW